jgi:hypothetical protein
VRASWWKWLLKRPLSTDRVKESFQYDEAEKSVLFTGIPRCLKSSLATKHCVAGENGKEKNSSGSSWGTLDTLVGSASFQAASSSLG